MTLTIKKGYTAQEPLCHSSHGSDFLNPIVRDHCDSSHILGSLIQITWLSVMEEEEEEEEEECYETIFEWYFILFFSSSLSTLGKSVYIIVNCHDHQNNNRIRMH